MFLFCVDGGWCWEVDVGSDGRMTYCSLWIPKAKDWTVVVVGWLLDVVDVCVCSEEQKRSWIERSTGGIYMISALWAQQ